MAIPEENTNANSANPTLPEDLISEIFSRLPTETLYELEDECESWKSLISSPEFIKAHLSRSTNDPHLTNHCLLLVTWPYVEQANIPYMRLSSYSINSLLNDETDETVSVTYDDENYHPGDDNIHVVGYCNGLLCVTSRVTNGEEIFLWNRFTGLWSKLPKHEHKHRVHGFCYDESNDDYKVFAIFGPGDDHEYNVSVFSSKSGCWRIIGDFYFGQVHDWGIFAGGAMNSLVGRNIQSLFPESYIIASIDIKTETYREFPLPPEEEGRRRTETTLDTFGGSLSTLYLFQTRADFWVMKECGVKESWTKLFTIPFSIKFNCSSIKPLCISVDGDIVFFCWSAVVLYSPKNDTFKKLLATEFYDDIIYVHTYVESRVRPPELAE